MVDAPNSERRFVPYDKVLGTTSGEFGSAREGIDATA